MEEKKETNQIEGSVSDAVFGTSSDAIIEGLHQGILTAQSFGDAPEGDEPGNKNQIVNGQDQQDITNAMDDEYAQDTTAPVAQQAPDSSPAMSKEEAASILSENEHLDEIGDSEESVSAKNSEKDKIN